MLYIVIMIGIIIGSFLNVCIYRIPKGESINFPRSHCMKCGHVLGAHELVPIFSYLLLGGKCKSCKSSISARYIIIEFITGVGFGVIYYRYGISVETILYCIFFSFSFVLTMIDWDYMILPTKIILWGSGFGVVMKIFQCVWNADVNILINAVIGAIVGYGLFLMLYYIALFLMKKEGLGYGDIRLMGFLGFYIGIDYIFIMMIIACLAASIFGVILLVIKRESKPYPLGPFLNFAAMIVILYGEEIHFFYISICNRIYGLV